MKILKLDPESCLQRKSRLRRKADVSYVGSNELVSVAPTQNKKKEVSNRPVKAPVADNSTRPLSQDNVLSKAAPSRAVQEPAASPRKQALPSTSTNLLDTDSIAETPASGKKNSTPSVPPPPAFVASPPTPPPAPEPSPPPAPVPPPEPALSREELAARREANVQEQVEEALREKREVRKIHFHTSTVNKQIIFGSYSNIAHSVTKLN